MCRNMVLEKFPCPLSPVIGNPDFPFAMFDKRFESLREHGGNAIVNFIQRGEWKPYNQLTKDRRLE